MTTTTKNTNSTLALHAIVFASLVARAAARQGRTRNLEPLSMSLSSTDHGTAAKTNGIGEVVDETYADADMEPIVEAPDTGVLNVNDGQISLIDVKDKNIEDVVASIIMYALGSTNIDGELKESVMTDMPSKKQWLGMKLEKKCHLLRLVLGKSKFHGLFDAFLDKICPPVADICTTTDTSDITDNSVGQGGCCGVNADCFNLNGQGTGEGYNECVDNKCVCQEEGENSYGQCCTEAGGDGENGCSSTGGVDGGYVCLEGGEDADGFPILYCVE